MRVRTLPRVLALAVALAASAAATLPAIAKCSATSLKGDWRITGNWGEETIPDDSRNGFAPMVRCDVQFNTKGAVDGSKCSPPLEYSIWTLTPKLRVNRRCEVSGTIVFAINSHSRQYKSAEFSAKVEGWIMESGDQMILMLNRREPGDNEPSEVSNLVGYRRP